MENEIRKDSLDSGDLEAGDDLNTSKTEKMKAQSSGPKNKRSRLP